MQMEYDDEAEMTQFVYRNYMSLMTDQERFIARAIIARAKASSTAAKHCREIILEKWGGIGDPAVDAALAGGSEQFRHQVRRRLLAQFADKVAINRCPNCQRVVRTPRSKQCLWCHHDWHEDTKE